MTLPDVGIHEDIPAEQYHRIDCASRSTLVQIASGESPAQVRWGMLNHRPSTPAQKLGTALHHLVLDPPEVFSEKVVLCPPFNRHKPAEREQRQTFIDEHEAAGRTVMEGTEQLDVLYAMGRALQQHPFCRTFLPTITHREVTLIWQHPDYGLTVKARLDAVLLSERQIIDIKTVRSVNPHYLKREIRARGYLHQGALYTRVAAALGIEVAHYVILWVQNERLIEVVPARLTDVTLAIGWRELDRPMQVMAECYESGIWPSQTDTIIDLSLPEWDERRAMSELTMADYEEV